MRRSYPPDIYRTALTATIKYFGDIYHGVYTPDNLYYPTIPMPNLQKLSLIVLASLSTLCLNATAQVYRSTDTQGNVSFSDTPTPGSEAVNIGEPNLSDAVEVPPPSSEPAPKPEPKPAPATQQSQPEMGNDDDGSGWYGRRAARRTHHIRREHRRR